MADNTPFEQVVHYTCIKCFETYDIDYLQKNADLRTICPICGEIQERPISNELLALRAQVERQGREIKILRQYGNKDCTAQADAALAQIESEKKQGK